MLGIDDNEYYNIEDCEVGKYFYVKKGQTRLLGARTNRKFELRGCDINGCWGRWANDLDDYDSVIFMRYELPLIFTDKLE